MGRVVLGGGALRAHQVGYNGVALTRLTVSRSTLSLTLSFISH
jgi:hypothetical protein